MSYLMRIINILVKNNLTLAKEYFKLLDKYLSKANIKRTELLSKVKPPEIIAAFENEC